MKLCLRIILEMYTYSHSQSTTTPGSSPTRAADYGQSWTRTLSWQRATRNMTPAGHIWSAWVTGGRTRTRRLSLMELVV